MSALAALHTENFLADNTIHDVALSQLYGISHVSFDASQAQDEHMKNPSQCRTKSKPEPVEREHNTETVNETTEGTNDDNLLLLPHQCLFCPEEFADGTDGFEHVLKHMSADHGLFIPYQSMLLDLVCFLGYLAIVVRERHECLYCGLTKNSTSAIQSHMRDSGHCMFNLERVPEISFFWQRMNDAEGNRLNHIIESDMVDEQELRLPSGKLVGSKGSSRRKTAAAGSGTRTRGPDTRPVMQAETAPRASAARSTSLSTSLATSTGQFKHQLSRRNEMGIRDLSPQQRQALLAAEKRSQKEEATATNAKNWSYARKSNSQKHDQAHGPLSCFKGGRHSLLPR